MGVRLANFVVAGLRSRGADAELVDAKAVGLPMLDRMYKEILKVARRRRWRRWPRRSEGPMPLSLSPVSTLGPAAGALTDHFLEEWFWRPAAIASDSAGRFSGVRSGTTWHAILSEMGMVVISSTLAVGPIAQTLDADGRPTGAAGEALQRAFPRFADDLQWWDRSGARTTPATRLPVLTPLRLPPRVGQGRLLPPQ